MFIAQEPPARWRSAPRAPSSARFAAIFEHVLEGRSIGGRARKVRTEAPEKLAVGV